MKTLLEALATKIDSEVQLTNIRDEFFLGAKNSSYMFGAESLTISWWAEREQLRINNQHYDTTEVLNAINSKLPLYAHISKVDPTRVAYTPDKSFGERDAQLIISIGKLLARHFPALRDEVVQRLVADHEAELSNEVEFIEHDHIASTYAQPGGTGACMSHPPGKYDSGISPMAALEVPNVRLAVLRDTNGTINARSLVYEPTPTDKRFIRCYGNLKLKKRLGRLGYTAGTWHGLELKVVPVIGNKYVMPYLDGNGVAGGPQTSYVAMIDGKITCITDEHATALMNVSRESVFCATGTSGVATLKNLDSSSFRVIDYITGLATSKLEPHTKLWVDGVEHVTVSTDLVDWVSATTFIGENRVSRVMRIADTINLGSKVLDRSQLERFGYVKVDESLYGPEVYSLSSGTTTTVDGLVIYKRDSVRYLTNDIVRTAHKSYIVTKGKDRHVKLADDAYASPTQKLYVTPSGRRVHPLINNLSKLWDGSYDYPRNVRSTHILGIFFNVSKVIPDSEALSSAIYKRAWDSQLAKTLDNLSHYSAIGLSTTFARLWERTNNYATLIGYDANYRSVRPASQDTAAESMEKIAIICENLKPSYPEITVLKYVMEVVYAEMTATEAPHRLSDPESAAVPAITDCDATAAILALSLSSTEQPALA